MLHVLAAVRHTLGSEQNNNPYIIYVQKKKKNMPRK